MPVAVEHVRSTQLFSELPAELLQRISSTAEALSLAAGDLVFEAGQAGRALFGIVSGTCEVLSLDGAVVASIGAGAIVGEIQLLSGGVRTATVRCASAAELFSISTETMQTVLAEAPEFSRALTNVVIKRVLHGRLVTSVGAALGIDDLQGAEQIVEAGQWRRLSAGEVLCREGEDADAWFLLISGHLQEHGDHETARAALELIFSVMRAIDMGGDDILFFVDDGVGKSLGEFNERFEALVRDGQGLRCNCAIQCLPELLITEEVECAVDHNEKGASVQMLNLLPD